jgi:hypothetical protein
MKPTSHRVADELKSDAKTTLPSRSVGDRAPVGKPLDPSLLKAVSGGLATPVRRW